jgi:hypothetical protein
MKILGILLIVAGVLALVYGGFTYVQDRDEADLGPLEVAVEDRERVRISPILGVLGIAAGTALVWAGARRRSPV